MKTRTAIAAVTIGLAAAVALIVATDDAAGTMTLEQFVAHHEAACRAEGVALATCMDWKRVSAALAIKRIAESTPRLVTGCEAEHGPDPILVGYCLSKMLGTLPAAEAPT